MSDEGVPEPSDGRLGNGADPAASTRPNRLWTRLGIALAVVLALGGLAVVGLFVVVIVGINQWGSNK